MSPEDPRHGSYAGAAAHWRAGETACDRCLPAARRRRKLNRYLELVGTPATVPALGTVRRIRALMALGWSVEAIARESGVAVKTLRNPCHRGQSVYRATADAVAECYERLSMTFPEGGYATRNRNLAKRKGWLPPLAYDDIDAPDGLAQGSDSTDALDPVVVERILAGDWRLSANRAERLEVVRRWRGSLAELEARTGWNCHRDRRLADAS